MSQSFIGIHHITVIGGPPKPNKHFYTEVLGLRLVKKTVNFDDPFTYHLYYGDKTGTPGTILTFFPWSDAVQGKPGVGQAVSISFSVPEQSLTFWMERFAELGISFEMPIDRFGTKVVAFQDPDRLQLELVADPAAKNLAGYEQPGIPADHAIRGFYGTTLQLSDYEPTGRVLSRVLGFEFEGEENGRYRYAANVPELGSVVDIVVSEGRSGSMGKGTIHHVAFRAEDEDDQLQQRRELVGLGLNVTSVKDRQYFRSIYFHEPGGVLFEIATDPPGFLRDEEEAHLGEDLKLPPWLEPRREVIEQRIVPLD